MRAKHQKQNHSRKGLLRRAIAVGMAAAMIYTTALSCSALEMEVVDDATGLTKYVDLDDIDEDTTDMDDILDLVEDDTTPDDADDTEEVDTPEDADEVLDDAKEPDTTDEEEEEPDKSDEGDSKEEDTAKDEISSDEEDTADDEDFIDIGMLDEDEGEGEITLYADASHSVYEAWYSKGRFYKNSSCVSGDEIAPSGTTMQKFIDDYCASDTTITLASTYTVASGASEKWEPSGKITLMRAYGVNGLSVAGTLEIGGNLTLAVPDDSGTGASVTIKGGTLIINDGVKLMGCNDPNGQVGGVVCMYGGTFTMNGGTLTGGNVGTSGGAVQVWENAEFIMKGGVISGNSAKSSGGGVYVADTSTFTMEGGAISGNTAIKGGGVYMAGKTFKMTGGVIGDENDTANGNTASSGTGKGGGVYLCSGTFSMTGGFISGNTCENNGGGVYIIDDGIFDMEGGTISKNKATKFGGGVTVSSSGNGKFMMSGGWITGNECEQSSAVSKGGGTFEVSGGTIADNKYSSTTVKTGEVSVNADGGGTMIITGGSIKSINDKDLPQYIQDKYGNTLEQHTISGFSPNTQYSMDIEYTYKGVKYTYPCDNVYADDEGNIYPWLPVGSKIEGGTGDMPRISVIVPLSLTVNVSPTGDCGITPSMGPETIDKVPITVYAASASSNGTITNNSTVPIYLTEVTFTWNTTATTTDGETTPAPSDIFTNWSTKPTINLDVDGSVITKETQDNAIIWTLNKAISENGGTLDLNWSFDLNGNSISQELQADTLAPIGTIVYTVSYQDPSKTGSTAA